ncbi:MAG: tetratricopeptide repeat protein [Anaerolineae bacterium]|nr:tetratricopeptide repeat protein [Anaerolineae bacterium]
MADGHCFISYSNGDADEFGPQLANELEGGNLYIETWYDKRDIPAGATWDEKVPEAIKTCKCFIFVMTKDSIAEKSICAEEWEIALRYKRPILLLRLDKDIKETPFRLGKRQWIDFAVNPKAGMAKLRLAIQRLDSPEGQLDLLKDRLADAKRDLVRIEETDEKTRIESEIKELNEEIKATELIKKDPEKARKQTRKNINAGLERDRQPINPISAQTSSKFINPRPGSIPDYFEGRLIETQEIADFLRNDNQRIMTIIGRAGSGKTVLTCRVLQRLENGEFPNDLGQFKVGGIVYLSEIGNYKINVPNIFSGLLHLLPTEKASKIDAIYREEKKPIDEKFRALLGELPREPVILLLDNFEGLLDSENEEINDHELYSALLTILRADKHNLKVVITTRIVPRQLSLAETARQHIKHLEEGLPSPFAENVLRKMDADGQAGLRDATDELLGKVREATLGYPRALESLYAILRVDRYSNVEELLAEGVPETVVEKFVGEAFSRLDSTKQKVIQTLAVYKRPVSYASIDFALQFHIPGINSASILERLVSMHFVRRESKRYFLHPADSDYALSRIPYGNPEKKSGQGARARTWDQHSLTLRAADYFAEIRKPRSEWKKLDDLSPQLAEFDLRCVAGDYDTAASVLFEIDFNYLLLWGHFRLMIEMHEKLQNKIKDILLKKSSLANLGTAYVHIGKFREGSESIKKAINISRQAKHQRAEGVLLGNLGSTYADWGDPRKAIEYYEQALIIDRENGDQINEGRWLYGISNQYASLGDVQKAIEGYEQSLIILRKFGVRKDEGNVLSNLGNRYAELGNINKAIEFYEQSLVIHSEIGDRGGKGNSLHKLGNGYIVLGNVGKAIEYYEQALVIALEIGDRSSESIVLVNIGNALLILGDLQKAKEYFQQATQIADEISLPPLQNSARCGLTETCLLQNNLLNARLTIETALQYDILNNYYNGTALHGIIALRQGERETAQEAFMKSIAQADEILAKTPEYYDALDAKGLALCGLILCRGAVPAPNDAIETFRKARKIAPHAGVVKRNLRLFDELMKCEGGEILKDVRNAVEGK